MNTDMDIDINTMTDTITCKLVEARADLGITQKELASATGISLKTIAKICPRFNKSAGNCVCHGVYVYIHISIHIYAPPNSELFRSVPL